MGEHDTHDVERNAVPDGDLREGEYDDSAASSAPDEEQAQAKVEDVGASQGGKGRPE